MKKTVVAVAIIGLGISAAQAQEQVVKIGAVAPLTGTIAHLGKDLENGARLAIEEANAKGVTIAGKKVKLELLGEDDQADPRTGTTVAQRLVDAGVKAVVGHLNSGTSIPASRIYDQAGIAQVTPASTNPKLTQQGYKGVFRTIANDVQQGSVLGKFAATNLGAKKIAIIDDRTAYGQGLADETEKGAKSSGAQIVAREFTTDKATDFNAILTKIRATNPDVIFFGGMDAQAGPMLRQIKQLGISAKFLTGDGGCSPEMIKLAGDAINANTYCSMAGLPIDKMPGGADFRERYKKRYNADVQIYSPYAYDAATAIITAMQKAGSAEPAKYLPELKKVNFPGVIGNISFDDKGDLKEGSITMYQFKNGDWAPL
ncbi:branched chain amino acid ABC transporter substrate-binding protein [Azoarcus sp. DD4]|uniref:branched-chain amino acid ABC transporter substrate-binding protein n=1 Tax=Azoarcus sp. DD4 TaxID=2027405 RepID=UPI0011271054|nr:branched-chain amino acid ABC transporter substrate-binding protein [Azoarcus sp. DD4]QDF99156.1 branched chain amino acid ABC transporter substrate-binding protein [Azoarcus sp. DD4]